MSIDILLLVGAAVVVAGVVVAKIGDRLGLPALLLFLVFAGTQWVHIPAGHDRSASTLACAQIPLLTPLSGIIMQCQR
jgi:NhaP-type Na+/H+ and K+/H+ antiporter